MRLWGGVWVRVQDRKEWDGKKLLQKIFIYGKLEKKIQGKGF